MSIFNIRVGKDEILVTEVGSHARDSPPKPHQKNEGRSPQSISRSKSSIREIGRNHDWAYLITLTFAPMMIRRYGSIKKLMQVVMRRLRYLRDVYGGSAGDLCWLLVPEPYPDHRRLLHIHGLISGIPPDRLLPFSHLRSRAKTAKYINGVIRDDGIICDWPDYSSRYGYCTLLPVTADDDVKKWINYMVKSMSETDDPRSMGAHRYYSSREVRRYEKVGQVEATDEMRTAIEAMATNIYAHRSDPHGPILGRTYVVDKDDLDGNAKVKKFFGIDY